MNNTGLGNPTQNTDEKPTRTQKAILWGQDDLLAQAVALLLTQSMTWDVTRISSENGADDLFEGTRQIHPDVVILCVDTVREIDSLMPLWLINEQLCSKVIAVGLESNLMQVYSKQDVILQGATDLLSIIETRNSSICTPEEEVKPE
jgi:hypothetical protein